MNEIGTIKLEDLNPIEHTIDWASIMKSIKNINLDEFVNNELEFLYDEYQTFLNNYETIEDKNTYNETTRLNELLYLHSMEMQQSEKIQMLKEIEEGVQTNSITFLSEKIITYGDVIVPNIKRLNSILKAGFSLQEEKYKSFRSSDKIFVGYKTDNNKVHIEYVPPLPNELDTATNDILAYLNDRDFKGNNNSYVLFIKPLIAHALMTILQPFDDGNSRTSRVLNEVDMMYTTNCLFDAKLEYPLLYLSRGYFIYHQQYRELIKNIALEPTDNNWNKWLLFGLHNIEDYIEYSNNYIAENNFSKKNI